MGYKNNEVKGRITPGSSYIDDITKNTGIKLYKKKTQKNYFINNYQLKYTYTNDCLIIY